MDAETEVVVSAQSVYLDPDLFLAFKVKATAERKGVNQALNDVLADQVGMPRRRIITNRPRKLAESA